MPESESGALPFGESPSENEVYYIKGQEIMQAFFRKKFAGISIVRFMLYDKHGKDKIS